MTAEQMTDFRDRLTAWYRQHRRSLPWRETSDPYAIWVSEVMLQQTQVATVIPYYKRFMARFPEISDLAAADLQDILKSWEGLGYYARARNLHRAARMVVTENSGRIPDSWGAFRKLPGVGDYIGAAVLSIAFRQAHAVVDGNVKRVLARLGMKNEPINRPACHKVFRRAAEDLLDTRAPGRFNQAMMELGALVCKPAGPVCTRCPVNNFCRAWQAGRTADYPRREKRSPVPEVPIAIGVVWQGDRVLITRRPTDGLLGGLWEFPGGKVKVDETPEASCVREIREEVNLEVDIQKRLARIRHAYTHFRIRADVFICRLVAGQVTLNGPTDHRWVRMDEIDAYPFPKANHKFIPKLKHWMEKRSAGLDSTAPDEETQS
jgi:A/G-specific adenine glycosylase